MHLSNNVTIINNVTSINKESKKDDIYFNKYSAALLKATTHLSNIVDALLYCSLRDEPDHFHLFLLPNPRQKTCNDTISVPHFNIKFLYPFNYLCGKNHVGSNIE